MTSGAMTEIISQPLEEPTNARRGDDVLVPGEAVSRREALTRGASVASSAMAAVAIGAVPLALGVFARRAQAQAPASARGVLEFAYLLENLESEFYKAILGTSATAAQNTAFAPVRALLQSDPRLIGTLQQIAKHEAAHVEFLKAQIIALGGVAPTYTGAEFDFTGGNGGTFPGPFSTVRNDPATVLILAQIFEDTGVRAYKGQLDKLLGNTELLTAIMKIHSVEARHSARIRLLRNVTGLKPWITSTATVTTTGITAQGGLTASTASIYATAKGYGRASGSFITEGFTVGQQITAAGFSNAANNGVSTITAVPALATTDKTQGTTTIRASLSATATGYARTTGSFMADGFAVGRQITASGFATAANNGRSTITALTDATLTVSKTVPTVPEAEAGARTIVADATIEVSKTPANVAEATGTGRYLVSRLGMAPGGSAIVTRAYLRETNSVQNGLNVSGLGTNTGGVGGVNEAFDEPLTYDDVIFIIKDFVIGTTP
jgi:hypothetical protein